VNVIIEYKSSLNVHDKLMNIAIMLIVVWQEARIVTEKCWKSISFLIIESSEGEAYRRSENEIDILQLLKVECVWLVQIRIISWHTLTQYNERVACSKQEVRWMTKMKSVVSFIFLEKSKMRRIFKSIINDLERSVKLWLRTLDWLWFVDCQVWRECRLRVLTLDRLRFK